MGLIFSDIYENHPNYCRWVLITAEQGEEMRDTQLLRLAAYIQQRETEEASGEQALKSNYHRESAYQTLDTLLGYAAQLVSARTKYHSLEGDVFGDLCWHFGISYHMWPLAK